MKIISLWIGEEFKEGDFIRLKPPADGDLHHRYYFDKEMTDAIHEGKFLGEKQSQSFREEGYMTGPISEIKLMYGNPGILLVWIRIPMPVKDSEASASLSSLSKIWTLLWVGLKSFWTKISDANARQVRTQMIADYEAINGEVPLTEAEEDTFMTCLTRNVADDKRHQEELALLEQIDEEERIKHEKGKAAAALLTDGEDCIEPGKTVMKGVFPRPATRVTDLLGEYSELLAGRENASASGSTRASISDVPGMFQERI